MQLHMEAMLMFLQNWKDATKHTRPTSQLVGTRQVKKNYSGYKNHLRLHRE